MFRSILLCFAVPSLVNAQRNSGSGTTTRYWDCCKPSCTWPVNAAADVPLDSSYGSVLSCNKDGTTADSNSKSICLGGGGAGVAYTCVDQMPFEEGGMLFAFAASNLPFCCSCYELTFTNTALKDRKMIIQVTNRGGPAGNFDILTPGGGFGDFNGCAANNGDDPSYPNDNLNGDPQFSAPYSAWGIRFGGVSSAADCINLPADVQAGCLWRFNEYQGADNPNVDYRRVQCPDQLTAKSNCKLNDDSSFPVADLGGSTSSPTTTTPTSTGATNAPSSPTAYATSEGLYQLLLSLMLLLLNFS